MTQGNIRIIGGEWRGRKLKVPDLPNLRPTPNRVRETLFNWLQPVIVGARCLDMFAGSGALGFEAASRGASHVVMVDNSGVIVQLLQQECDILRAPQVEIYRAQVPKQLRKPEKPFDIVFIDPPYQSDVLLPCCFYLEENGFLAEDARIYLEAPALIHEKHLPRRWRLIKNQRAGDVFYHLALRDMGEG
ncbi:MAG: 16S rRNA (guanine(966)-N(2))-methyltransferase RsmD [Gammaproteobacteria bacterium]|nr:16S rRNA (guanine(966)-N(2))-methyltransferase RsmD [Gammaproteobacteria bacterium]